VSLEANSGNATVMVAVPSSMVGSSNFTVMVSAVSGTVGNVMVYAQAGSMASSTSYYAMLSISGSASGMLNVPLFGSGTTAATWYVQVINMAASAQALDVAVNYTMPMSAFRFGGGVCRLCSASLLVSRLRWRSRVDHERVAVERDAGHLVERGGVVRAV